MKYHEQIKHPLWQRKRLEVLELNGFKCQDCGAKEEELHVHHPFYKRGAMIWDYETNDLRCLCHKCHKEIHVIDEQIKTRLSDYTYEEKLRVLGYIEGASGFADKNMVVSEEYCIGLVDALHRHPQHLAKIYCKGLTINLITGCD